ncbi:MAG: UDP-N-acetylglucosamine--N-acetylmuramyl-(pentapeptide) pyrophosphoryl-undecaprenol N-acetylglucosamine transferase [Opitutaceae bacterium]|nr:UDP-N-acetylglucosamine--N-acetylmuramyl-(pentapeptide) pyrophosphoryl-undecaprenol N-acetylglucosamine transferase [Opitutaceae bacterium]
MSGFLIACGGTGGHLAPGIALAEELLSRGHKCTLLISDKQVDSRLIEKYKNLQFEVLPGSGFSLQPARLLRFFISQMKGLVVAFRLIKELKPEVIFGFGGFTCIAITFCGLLNRVPVALHEANRIPGKAVRFIGGFAKRVYLPTDVKVRYIKASRVRYYGYPVRKEIVQISKVEARGRLGMNPKQKVLVILGGSQGASALNDWARSVMEKLARDEVQVYCVTGLGKGRDEIFEYESSSGVKVRSGFIAFSDQVGDLLSSADLAVSRAGAGTIAEMTCCGLPSILIPNPHSADNHQEENAKFFETQGGGFLVNQEFMDDLYKEVKEVIFNEGLLQQLGINLKCMDRDNSANLIADDLENLSSRGGASEPRLPATEVSCERSQL